MFAVLVTEESGGLVFVELLGELDRTVLGRCRSQLHDAAPEDPASCVAVDLRSLDFCCVAGVRELLRFGLALRARGVSVCLVAEPGTHLRAVFEIARGRADVPLLAAGEVGVWAVLARIDR
ncbi:STAS domain-containing protein [Actinokineospora bangkokensis]|uniref:STAS domain-containing protein n=1 Tax=Actinokineospora bangkokensis TaxID=1193682 RepID=A0A1Q9LN56_9PSEU|nr:STAS domain-containing protein [Actinokineospora bangkokensis]OLR93472.1 hypothetical protein BJP25_14285 [Actinokineospora bangkokensis]